MSPVLSLCRAALLFVLAVALLAGTSARHTGTRARPRGTAVTEDASRFLDLSLLVAPEFPCTWPTFPPFQLNHYQRIGPTSAYNSDIIVMDGNTGTQLDVPTHSVTPPASGWANSGVAGLITTEKVPAWQFGGEACVIDCKKLLDAAPNGRSDLIKKQHVFL